MKERLNILQACSFISFWSGRDGAQNARIRIDRPLVLERTLDFQYFHRRLSHVASWELEG